jgi:hypothetical protein
MDIFKSKYLDIDTMYRSHTIGVGADIGSNRRSYGKIKNFYIEFTFLFWTLGFEFKW